MSATTPLHFHHDLQYLFIANPALPNVVQLEDVQAARWAPIDRLADISLKAAKRPLSAMNLN